MTPEIQGGSQCLDVLPESLPSLSKKKSRVNSQGFDEQAMAAIQAANGLLPNKKPPSGKDEQQNYVLILDSPDQRTKPTHSKIRQSHQKELQASRGDTELKKKKDEGETNNSRVPPRCPEKPHLDQSLQLKIIENQKNRSKSSTRDRENYPWSNRVPQQSSNLNSNHDSASNLLHHFYAHPSIDMSPSDQVRGGLIESGSPSKMTQAIGNGLLGDSIQSMKLNNDITQQQLHMVVSTQSQKSQYNSNQPNVMRNNFTLRSQKSQNSDQHSYRADVLSLQQKSPNLRSDIQDPYAYFNMHQTQGQPQLSGSPRQRAALLGIQPKKAIKISMGSIQNSEQRQNVPMLHGLSLHNALALQNQQQQSIRNNSSKSGAEKPIVKSCRPNLYSKNQMISQRDDKQAFLHQQQALANFIKQQGSKKNRQSLMVGQAENPQMKIFENMELNEGMTPPEQPRKEAVPILTNNSVVYHDNYQNKQSQGIAGLVSRSVESGSRGSNYNSSVSTFPAAPFQKLSDVQNPQKFMTFRFANRKATKISDIGLFKNLQELDLSGNLLKEQVQDLFALNFLKRLNLSNNSIEHPWAVPPSIEILNLSYNQIKSINQDVTRKLKNLTTLDISNNKLESLENFEYLKRMKRLVAKNNFIRELQPISNLSSIYEIDLESNAIDSHKDFLGFIKGKNDLIVVNLALNPIMVEVTSIEKLNEDLIQGAPDMVTLKTQEEIEEIKDLLLNKDSDLKQPNQDGSNDISMYNSQDEPGQRVSMPGNISKQEEDLQCLSLIQELQDCLTFLKGNILYRNRRVFTKIKQIQIKSKRSASNNSNSSNSFVPAASGNRSGKAFGTPSGVKNFPSPIVSKKSQRYEDVEVAYDYIVEQEELKRLKQNKILAKRRKMKKKQMMSHLDGCVDQESSNSSSENQFGSFSDDEIDDDYIDDFEDSRNLQPHELDLADTPGYNGDALCFDASCIINEKGDSSQLLDYSQFPQYQQQPLHDAEALSQTITSDLDADLHSYKRGEEGPDNDQYYQSNMEQQDKIKIDDNEFLNGSTAGFGKKLREINREINEEQQLFDLNDHPSLNSQQVLVSNDALSEKPQSHDSLPPKFELNLSNIHQDIVKPDQKTEEKSNYTLQPAQEEESKESRQNSISKLPSKKLVKTVQNSHESSRVNSNQFELGVQSQKVNEQQQLNQSFSLRNIQHPIESNSNKHDEESLMMNKFIIQKSQNEGAFGHELPFYNEMAAANGNLNMKILIDSNKSQESLRHQLKQDLQNSNPKILLESQSQSLYANDQQSTNQMVSLNQTGNQSLMNESIVQSSTVSGNQNSKKNFVPKIDLSKLPATSGKKKSKAGALSDSKVGSHKGSKNISETSIEKNLPSELIQEQNIEIVLGQEVLPRKSTRREKPSEEVKLFKMNQMSKKEKLNVPLQSSVKKNPNGAINVVVSPQAFEKLQLIQKEGIKEAGSQRSPRESYPVEGSVNLGKYNTERQEQDKFSSQKVSEDQDSKINKNLKLLKVKAAKRNTPGIAQQPDIVINKCQALQTEIEMLKSAHQQEIASLKTNIQKLQKPLMEIKQFLNIAGSLELCGYQGEKSTRVIRLNDFGRIVNHFFFRLYKDYEKVNHRIQSREVQHSQRMKDLQSRHDQELEKLRLTHAFSYSELERHQILAVPQHQFLSGSKMRQQSTESNNFEHFDSCPKNVDAVYQIQKLDRDFNFHSGAARTKRSKNEGHISSINQLNHYIDEESEDAKSVKFMPPPAKVKTCRRHMKRKSCNSSYGHDRNAILISNNALSCHYENQGSVNDEFAQNTTDLIPNSALLQFQQHSQQISLKSIQKQKHKLAPQNSQGKQQKHGSKSKTSKKNPTVQRFEDLEWRPKVNGRDKVTLQINKAHIMHKAKPQLKKLSSDLTSDYQYSEDHKVVMQSAKQEYGGNLQAQILPSHAQQMSGPVVNISPVLYDQGVVDNQGAVQQPKTMRSNVSSQQRQQKFLQNRNNNSLNSSNKIQQINHNANIAGAHTKKQLTLQQKTALSNISSFTNGLVNSANMTRFGPEDCQQQQIIDSCSSSFPQHSNQSGLNGKISLGTSNIQGGKFEIEDIKHLLDHTKLSLENSLTTNPMNSFQANSHSRQDLVVSQSFVKQPGKKSSSKSQSKSKSQRNQLSASAKQGQQKNIQIQNNSNLQFLQQQLLRYQANTSRGPKVSAGLMGPGVPCLGGPIAKIGIGSSSGGTPILVGANASSAANNSSQPTRQSQSKQASSKIVSKASNTEEGQPKAQTKQQNSVRSNQKKKVAQQPNFVNIDLNQVQTTNHLQKSLEQIKSVSQQNYKTSRIPISDSRVLIEDSSDFNSGDLDGKLFQFHLSEQQERKQQEQQMYAPVEQKDVYMGNYSLRKQQQPSKKASKGNKGVQKNSQQLVLDVSQIEFSGEGNKQGIQHSALLPQGNSMQVQTPGLSQQTPETQFHYEQQYNQPFTFLPVTQMVTPSQPSYHTQRKTAQQPLNIKNVASKLVGGENTKTHRNQQIQSLLAKSGNQGNHTEGEPQTAKVSSKMVMIQQKAKPNRIFDQLQDTSSKFELSIDSKNAKSSMYQHKQRRDGDGSKRPQSVVESGGRKFQKIQQSNNQKQNRKGSINRQGRTNNQDSMMRVHSSSVNKSYKSAERRSSKAGRLGSNLQPRFSNQ